MILVIATSASVTSVPDLLSIKASDTPIIKVPVFTYARSTFVVCMYRVYALLCHPSSVGILWWLYLAAIKFSCCQLCYKNVLLVVKEKQLSLMNYLGEWWSFGEGGCIRGPGQRRYPGASAHLRKVTQEQRDWGHLAHLLTVQPHAIWALAWQSMLWGPGSYGPGGGRGVTVGEAGPIEKDLGDHFGKVSS